MVMLACLAVLAGIDLKIREIPVVPVVVLGIGFAVYRLWNGADVLELVLGVVPGVLLLVLAVCSGESIGVGDGLVLLVFGIFCGVAQAVAVLGMALLLAAVLAMLLMVFRRAGRKTELPFLPCLFGGYLLCIMW